MKLAAIPLVVLLAAATSRDGCGNGRAYAPCEGKVCGEACTVCDPDDRGCAETAIAKACDPQGRCVGATAGMCGGAAACAGKACGEECLYEPPCRTAVPPCMMPSVLGHCDPSGACVAGTPSPNFCAPPPPPSWGCVGKVCGDSCGFCPPDMDPASCPVPTFAPTACDARLQCVTEGTFTCPPAYDPCEGKACGEGCQVCPPGATGCAETMELKACDAAGKCLSRTPDLVCPP